MKKLLNRGGLYSLGSLGPVIAGLFITPLITKTLGLQEYGYLAISLVTISTVSILLSFGLPTALLRKYRDLTSSDVAKLAFTAIIFITLCGGAVAGIAVISRLPIYLSSAIVLGSFQASTSITLSFLIAKDKPIAYAIFTLVPSLAAPACGWVFLQTNSTALTYITGFGVPIMIGFVSGALYFGWNGRGLSRILLLNSLHYSSGMVPHFLAIGVISSGLVYLSAISQSVEFAGLVQLSLLVGSIPIVAISALSNTWTPILFHSIGSNFNEVWHRTTKAVGWLAFTGSLFIQSLALEISKYLLPANYPSLQLTKLILFASISGTFVAFGIAYNQAILATGTTLPLAWLTPISLILALASGWGLLQFSAILIPLGLGGFYLFQILIYRTYLRVWRKVFFEDDFVWPLIGLSLAATGLLYCQAIVNVSLFVRYFETTVILIFGVCILVKFVRER